ncbi:hypothetical protein Tco_1061694 [Tanacetum coccineum]
MVDVPIYQEDPTVQRSPLIDTVILMVTDKTSSTPTPPTTQAQVQMCPTSCWKDSSRESRKLCLYKDGDGAILFWQKQAHYRMLILDQLTQRNHKSSSIYQERYEHVSPQDTRSQDGERPQVDDQRLDSADDLKESQDHISSTIKDC